MVTLDPDAAPERSSEPFPGRIHALLLEAARRGKPGLLQEDATAALRWIEARQEDLRRQRHWRTHFVCADRGLLLLRQVVVGGEGSEQGSVFELFGPDGTRIYSSNFEDAVMEVFQAEIKRVEAEAEDRPQRFPRP
ncbi:hypothetical protein QTI33_08655 [Variovorax sp. J22P271]|uniref:hypothetical protein n=1 Tax=Variovorax davisae TaxID=3053515 RepID=UPI002574E620|nr:hypothetical protein [Variovorax sp. J22P271]MDM0032203.1 hypothetical protein [Variovorax sp. J22P271]